MFLIEFISKFVAILVIITVFFIMIIFSKKGKEQKEMIDMDSRRYGDVFENFRNTKESIYIIGNIKEIIEDVRNITINNKPLYFVIVEIVVNGKTYKNSFSRALNLYMDKRWAVNNPVPLYINCKKNKIEYVPSKEKFIKEYLYSISEEKLELMYPPNPYKRIVLVLGILILLSFVAMFIAVITEIWQEW